MTLAGTVALPAGEEGWFGPQTVTLQGVEESTASRGSVQSVFLDKEGQTITYLSYFSRDTAWPAGDLRLSVGDFVSDDASLTQEVAQVTWTPENQGTVLEGTVQNPAGEAVGSVTLTPFSLSYAFTEGAHLELEEINGMALPNAYLLDSQGMARRAGSASGGGKNWSTTFRTPLDLTPSRRWRWRGMWSPWARGRRCRRTGMPRPRNRPPGTGCCSTSAWTRRSTPTLPTGRTGGTCSPWRRSWACCGPPGGHGGGQPAGVLPG